MNNKRSYEEDNLIYFFISTDKTTFNIVNKVILKYVYYVVFASSLSMFPIVNNYIISALVENDF